MHRRFISFVFMCSLVSLAHAAGEDRSQTMKEDKTHVNQWNKFADACLQSHKRRISQNKIVTKNRKGGYYGRPNFYNEITYKHADTGKMLSRVQWEAANPEVVHVIELFDYDDKGRIQRDYTAAYLPGARNAPVQTLASFHIYNDDLHAFRSFDANREAVFERCSGTLSGKSVSISLEDYEIEDVRNGINPLAGSPAYQACFKGMPLKPGEDLLPD